MDSRCRFRIWSPPRCTSDRSSASSSTTGAIDSSNSRRPATTATSRPEWLKFLNPDYAALAEACFCKGISVSEYDDLLPAIEAAHFADDGPVVVDCNVDPDALLIPPAVTPHMAANYVKSEIKSWFTAPSDDAKRLADLAAKHEQQSKG